MIFVIAKFKKLCFSVSIIDLKHGQCNQAYYHYKGTIDWKYRKVVCRQMESEKGATKGTQVITKAVNESVRILR